MKRILNLIRIAFKSLLSKNRGNILFVICVFLLLLIPTIQFNITQSVMNQVEVSHKRVFGIFTDIYYDNTELDNMDLSFSDSDFSKLLPGFNYDSFGVFSIVYQQKIDEAKTLRLGFADEVALELADVILLEGYYPENSNEIALTESIVDALGRTGLGDKIEIADSEYTISGILLDFGHLWPQSEEQKDKNIGSLNALITEQEANRVYNLTSQISRQILIVRQLGVSSPTENDHNLLRNTNNSLENSSSFKVPNEFAILMIIALLVCVFMIFILNRNRLSNRICSYHNLGLCKIDIIFVIRFELIFLGLIGSILGIAFGCLISLILINALPVHFENTISLYINWNIIVILFLSVIIGMTLLIFFYSRLVVKTSLEENADCIDRCKQKNQKNSLFRFVIRQNRYSLLAFFILVVISFSMFSLGIFYSRYFCSDIYEQPTGMLSKDYDFLFSAKTLPLIPLDGSDMPFYFTDTYEKMGADSDFVDQLILLPQVEQVKAYKEINKLNVLLTEEQIDDYIDAQDFALDKNYSEIIQTGITDMDFVREKFGYSMKEILVGAEILTYPDEILKSLERSVVEGEIDLEKIASGEEIVLRVPAYRIKSLDDQTVMKIYEPFGQDDVYNSNTFHVGDEIHLSGILSDQDIDGAVVKSQADLFYRKDVTVKVGAIIREVDGTFSSSGSFGKAFSILTVDSALEIYDLEAKYSNISVYSNPGYTTEEISQAISNLSNQVPNMIMNDFQKEVRTYKIYKLMVDIYVLSFIIVLAIATLIIMTSQLLAKTHLNKKNDALLRINGLSIWRLINFWLIQISCVVLIGCSIGILVSLLLFWSFGSYSYGETLTQINYYFSLKYFLYVFIGIAVITAISLVPSFANLLKNKDDVLNDIN